MNGVKATAYLTWGGQLGKGNGVQAEAWCEKVSAENTFRPLFAESDNLETMSDTDLEEIVEEIVASEEEMQASNHQAMHMEAWCEKVSFENALRPLLVESDGAEPMNVDIQPSTQPQELNLSSNTTTIHSRHDNNRRPLTRSLNQIEKPKKHHIVEQKMRADTAATYQRVKQQAKQDDITPNKERLKKFLVS